ncbi:thiamine-phosphate kinase [Candidatus Thioglobus sp. NP1]|uniref:thiamine-phosphate kinase n=1 Tax=Candidatus Thioglobus sp. NP1 TaxID=2508687 RepID=UPI000DED98B9|nr:thiamine-phosphate kinase [Candidatus Thioglobus sp. NP1]AXE62411.1 thiamine-phosphate kinase [Candidatus Thioglobus sp. NP1]
MNEFELIQSYFDWQLNDSTIATGIGDDAAIFNINKGFQLVTSTDILSEGVHFFKDTSASDIAYKSLAVNLSDIAAMGATAKYFTLALTLPKLDQVWLKDFSESLKLTSEMFKVSLIGGDTSRGPLNISITIMGVIENSKAILRSNAKVGDTIYVSGHIGDAAHCLKKIFGGLEPTKDELISLNRPFPRLNLGEALKEIANSCIDISDGLEQDLSHILKASNVGAEIDVRNLPLSKSLLNYVNNNNDWSVPLCGGDDYELCFTVPKTQEQLLKSISELCEVRITKIGVINNTKKLKIKGYDGPSNSYKHF